MLLARKSRLRCGHTHAVGHWQIKASRIDAGAVEETPSTQPKRAGRHSQQALGPDPRHSDGSALREVTGTGGHAHHHRGACFQFDPR